MTESSQPTTQEKARPGGRRPTLLNNVLWSWGGHLVFIASGFLLPRAIDLAAGKAVLGIWDFSWSIVAYFYLVEFGVSSSVNRFVAKHLAEKDTEGLNRSMSSVFCIQILVALTILLLTVAVVVTLPFIWKTRLGDLVTDAQWVIFFLGLSMAVAFGFGGFAGVLTGCHRWDIYNIISSACMALSLGAMLLSLRISGNIRLLGAMYAAGGVVMAIANMIAAHKVCPSLKVRLQYVDRATMSTMIGFGGKTFLNGVARSLLYQTSGLAMASVFGPAVLAMYNRPLALVQVIRTFTTKFAHTLTPIASELQAAGNPESLQALAVKVARVGVALVLPPVVFLSIMGGRVVLLWMGASYTDNHLPLILALGHLWAFANLPLQTILIGLNVHGRPALASVLSSAVCAAACWAVVGLWGGGMHAVAFCVGLTLTLVDGAYVTVFTCRKLGLPVWAFLKKVWLPPVMCVVPFALWLVAAAAILSPFEALLVGGIGGGVVLGVFYWQWILPGNVRGRIKSKLAAADVGLRSMLGVPLKERRAGGDQ